jgi:putative adhesin
MRHQLTVAVALTIAALPLWAQQDTQDARWVDECREHHYDSHEHGRFCEVRVELLAMPSGQLQIDARENGAVEIVAASGSGLVVHEQIEATGSTDADAQELASQVHVKTGSTIRADGPPQQGRHSQWTVSYRIEVPRKSDIMAESTNGPVEATNIVGKLDLRTENGPISLDGVGGSVYARTENGPLEVNLSGARWDGDRLDAETENGPVELTLPANYAAHLETGTENGPLSIDFPITVQGRFDLKRLSMDIGGGGPTVRAVTTNGPVTVGH